MFNAVLRLSERLVKSIPPEFIFAQVVRVIASKGGSLPMPRAGRLYSQLKGTGWATCSL